VRIKWPNDIYYKDKVKLGGILVSCFTLPGHKSITAVVGKIDVGGPLVATQVVLGDHLRGAIWFS
jgi:biotin-(acetyl-CoA carboxylase) ligase